MSASTTDDAVVPRRGARPASYVLDQQVGFVLRQASQRHTSIFASLMVGDLTSTQWAALSKLHEVGPSSQNQLGRLTAMDVATVKGVVDRLVNRGLVATEPDPADGRRLLVALTDEGRALVEEAMPIAWRITEETLKPLSEKERKLFLVLLSRLT
ncbi:MAG: MarR family winged helix-turn-helix transcriptional regulator [Parvibaculaceae bacterium]